MAFDFHDASALLQRLSRPNPPRPHVFLVGCALTMPLGRHRGVPGTGGVLDLIREHYRAAFPDALPDFERALEGSGANKYQAAFRHLAGRGGLEDANRIVRQAVLQAYAGSPIPDPANLTACQQTEHQIEHWPLSPWVDALGEVLSRTEPSRMAPLILTTNFDPLLGIAVRRSGGTAYLSVLDRDGKLGQAHGHGCHIVHLHGHWCVGDTLHTPSQLATERRSLKESLRRLLADKALVVLGYGGWDDIFASALVEALQSTEGRTELLWLFREAGPETETKYAALLQRLKAGCDRGEVALYSGVDLCALLPTLRDRLLPPPSPAPPRPAADSGGVPAALDSPPHHEADVLGRRPEKTALLAACRDRQAVQILGLPLVGKSYLLRWVRWFAPVGWKIAEIHAGGLSGRSPKDLVTAIAAAIGQPAAATTGFAAHADLPPARAAERVLRSLLPLVVLIDDADKLAEHHSFDAGFFDELRSQCQDRKLWWVSASQHELAALFQSTGLTSRFLNDSVKLPLGAIEADGVQPLLHGLSPQQVECLRAVAAGLPFETRWLADWMRSTAGQSLTASDLAQQATAALLLQLQTTFESRWRKLKKAERSLLRRCADAPIALAALADHERTTLLKLSQQGLLTEEPSGYTLRGTAWRQFVEGPHGR